MWRISGLGAGDTDRPPYFQPLAPKNSEKEDAHVVSRYK